MWCLFIPGWKPLAQVVVKKPQVLVDKRRRIQHSLALRCCTTDDTRKKRIGFVGIQHAGILVENTERALEFYVKVLGMEDASNERPGLPYKGAFIRVGPHQQIHLMELPSVDPKTGRPAHGGRDRHIALEVENLSELVQRLEQFGHPFTYSKSGRRAIFCRDWDGNALEFMETRV